MLARYAKRFPDVVVILLALTALNLHLVGLPIDHRPFVAAPSALLAGRWWTLLTHAFVHVSRYHLLLDAGAVLLLYPLLSNRPGQRMAALAICILGSVCGAMLDPEISAYGFCGLSGAGHGLMAICALQFANSTQRAERQVGGLLLVGLVLKSLYEALTGQVFLATLHAGSVGVPNTLSHLAGTLTGLRVFHGMYTRGSASTATERPKTGRHSGQTEKMPSRLAVLEHLIQ